jgi:hypothetical protein
VADARQRGARRVWDSIFPRMPDFYGMLADQSRHASETVGIVLRFMQTGIEDDGMAVRHEEHEADRTKARNIQVLNESFATPFDREDVYRAIMALDEVVNYCKTTVREMEVLAVGPDPHLVQMAALLAEGMESLAAGFGKLAKVPRAAGADADVARKAERRIEKAYRAALADLFRGEDYLGMFRRREVYRHISNAADRLADCAHTLNDIVVQIS